MTGGATEQFDGPAFEALQSRLSALWPALTLRTDEFDDRVALMVCSITVPDIPDSLVPLLPAFEERYLFTVLTLARAPRSLVVYITSSPLHERVLDYFIDLLPGPDRDSCRQRLTVLSIGDPSHRPLVEKILERPRFVERIRQAVGDPSKAILLPFISTAQEAELSVRLGIPLYGPDPRLSWLGTKSGSRETFANLRTEGMAVEDGPRLSGSCVSLESILRPLGHRRSRELPARVTTHVGYHPSTSRGTVHC